MNILLEIRDIDAGFINIYIDLFQDSTVDLPGLSGKSRIVWKPDRFLQI
jgi:hypothetical protein